MQFPEEVGADARSSALPRHESARSELNRLRATCRSQALAIDVLEDAVSALRRGAAALKAENADLRAEQDRLQNGHRGRARVGGGLRAAEPFDAGAASAVRFPCDVSAPGAARIVVAQCLRDQVAPDVLDNAQLLVSELITNSVRHSGAGTDDSVGVRISLSRTMVRLEVEDGGGEGAVALRRPDLNGGGFGLQLVQALSERWGMERVAEGGTRVWAQLQRTTATARSEPTHA